MAVGPEANMKCRISFEDSGDYEYDVPLGLTDDLIVLVGMGILFKNQWYYDCDNTGTVEKFEDGKWVMIYGQET